MQIEVGKRYLMRNGRVTAPLLRRNSRGRFTFTDREAHVGEVADYADYCDHAWTSVGKSDPFDRDSPIDIVAEWNSQPHGYVVLPDGMDPRCVVAPSMSEDVVEIAHISGENGDSFAYPISKHVPLAVDTANPKDLLGIKKPPLDLIPAAAELHESMAMANGAGKYGPYNWRGKQVRASIYIAAALRHLKSWQDGERVASDSGVHHLGHARACLGILLDAEATGNLIDDRPPAGAASRLIAEMTKA